MYKAGDKFIIEIGEEYESEFLKTNIEADKEQKESPVNLYRIRGFNSLVFDKNGLKELTKYDETVDSDAKAKEYEKGLSDSWECIIKIYGLQFCDIEDIYGKNNDTLLTVLENFTPQEAIDKLKEWEEKQEVKVGDVVKVANFQGDYVITMANREIFHCMDLKTGAFCIKNRGNIDKTGKHIDLTEIFKGLEGENV